jgi:hypothetical protein
MEPPGYHSRPVVTGEDITQFLEWNARAVDLPGDFRTSRNLRRWLPRKPRDHEKVEIQRRADGADRA